MIACRENLNFPLVSIYVVVKNAVNTIKRCLDSIVLQDYPNIEIIIQDGLSTDGTLEIIQPYKNKVILESESDSGISEGFHKAIKRCNGKYIIAILADEELLPHAVSSGVKNLQRFPEADVICGDINLIDNEGKIINQLESREWNYESVLLSEYCPFFCASFFKRTCFDAMDLMEIDPVMYEGYVDWCIWWKIGQTHSVKYVPGVVSNYGIHKYQLSNTVDRYYQHIDVRLKMIEHITSSEKSSSKVKKLKKKALAGCFLHNAERFVAFDSNKEAREEIIKALGYKPNMYRLLTLMSLLSQKGVDVSELLTLQIRMQMFSRKCMALIKLFRVKDIAIFGTGLSGEDTYQLCLNNGKNILFFLDNSAKKQGNKFLGLDIKSIDYLDTYASPKIEAIVIASWSGGKQIKSQLLEKEFKGKIIEYLA